MPLRRLALPLAILAWCALAIASLVLTLGPLSVPVIGVSISRATRLLVAATVLAIAATWLRGGIGLLLDDLSRSHAPYVATLVLVLAGLAAVLATHGAVSVGGADSAGYLAQAQRWRDGRLRVPLPLSIPGVSDPWVQSGLGLRPDASGSRTVPIYPPGLPWLEAAALRAAGEPGATRVVPAAAALVAVLAAWVIALPRVGHAGAVLVVTCLATLPPFLHQALQPMSDVPALGAWLAALALAARPSRLATSGAALSTFVAVLIRPNLAPLAMAVLWQATLPLPRPPHGAALRRTATILAAAVAAVLLVAGVQAFLYGSALQSGYGRASELFSVSYVPDNVRLYAAWLREAVAWPGLAVLAVGTAALAWLARQHAAWRPLTMAVLLTGVLYLVYIPFDSWTYLRFVLVALALVPAGAAHLLGILQGSRHGRWTFVVTAVLLLAVAISNLRLARELGVFTVRAREYRYEAAGRFVRDHLPADALIVAVQHSASAPYYSKRPVIRPDLLTPDGFRALQVWADREGRPLVFVLDEAEPAILRQRFGDAGLSALDWPPRAEIGRPVATRVWVHADRGLYLAGGRIRTTRLTSIPRG